MAKYLSRIYDKPKPAQGTDKNAKGIVVPKTSSYIISQRKGIRTLVMMMAEGDALQYKELFKFAVSDFLTKADQFTLAVEQRIKQHRQQQSQNPNQYRR